MERKLGEKEIGEKRKRKETGEEIKIEEKLVERIQKIEKNLEWKEKGKRNIIIKGVQKEKRDWR